MLITSRDFFWLSSSGDLLRAEQSVTADRRGGRASAATMDDPAAKRVALKLKMASMTKHAKRYVQYSDYAAMPCSMLHAPQ